MGQLTEFLAMGRNDQKLTLQAERSVRFGLRSFGKPCLFVNDQEVAVNSRKLLALVAYLSTRESLSESREKLAGLLWGDVSEDKARASLRQTLSKFRETTAGDLIESNRLDVWLVETGFQSDHAEIDLRLKQDHIDDRLLSISRLPGTFLEGYEDIDPGYRNWVMVHRQSIEDRFMRMLEAKLNRSSLAAERREAARAILNIEPTHEPAARAAMEALLQLGDPAGAVRVYNSLWEVLEKDFDTEPAIETQKLVARVKLSESVGFAESPTAIISPPALVPLPGASNLKLGHALFVADFEMEDASGDRKAVVRIFRAELIAALTRFRDWRVLEHSQLLGASDGHAHLIEANAYEVGSSLRFVLTLRELPGGKFVWSERFSLAPDGWFDTMRNVIRRIAVALEVNISSERLDRVTGKPVLSLELFDRWLRGQLSIFRWRPEEEAVAEQMFRSLIKDAPNFAPAYAGMAGILNARHLIFPGMERSPDAQREALFFASRAVELDPLDSRTQLHLAWSYAMNMEFQKAALTFQLAFELNGDDPWTLVSAAEGLALSGSLRESLELVRLAEETGLQFSELQWSYQAVVWFVAGRYDKCVNAAAKAEPSLNCCGGWAAAALALLGQTEDAKAMARGFAVSVSARWTASDRPSNEDISRWMLLGFPIASKTVKENLVRGLDLAGLPIPSALGLGYQQLDHGTLQ